MWCRLRKLVILWQLPYQTKKSPVCFHCSALIFLIYEKYSWICKQGGLCYVRAAASYGETRKAYSITWKSAPQTLFQTFMEGQPGGKLWYKDDDEDDDGDTSIFVLHFTRFPWVEHAVKDALLILQKVIMQNYTLIIWNWQKIANLTLKSSWSWCRQV